MTRVSRVALSAFTNDGNQIIEGNLVSVQARVKAIEGREEYDLNSTEELGEDIFASSRGPTTIVPSLPKSSFLQVQPQF